MSFANRKLAQVAIVVNDIEEASRRWAAILGVDVPKIITTDPGNDVNATYRGKPTNDKAHLAFLDMGGVQLELIQPLGTESAWYEGMPEKGERVHHLAFWTENMKESVEFLDQHGVPMMQRGDMGEGQYAYFDAGEQLNTFIELLEHKRTSLD